jgi:hypothetical protein
LEVRRRANPNRPGKIAGHPALIVQALPKPGR